MGEEGEQLYDSITSLVELFTTEAHLVDKLDGKKFRLHSEAAVVMREQASLPTQAKPAAHPESIYGTIAETTESDVSAAQAKAEGAIKKKESDYAVAIPLDDDSDSEGEELSF